MTEHIYIIKYLVSKNPQDVIDLYHLPTNLYYQNIYYNILDIRQEGVVINNNESLIQRVFINTKDSNELHKIGWVINHSMNVCMKCFNEFSLLFRNRHHCRLCGNLVCSSCLADSILIQNMTDFGVQLICKPCNESKDISWDFPIIGNGTSGKSIVKEEIIIDENVEKNKQNIAAQRIINLFRILIAMNIKTKLESKCPDLYLISIDKVIDIENLKDNINLNAYVSGIVRSSNNHQQLETVSISKLYFINSTTTAAANDRSNSNNNTYSSQYALVASDVKLSFISISIVKAKSAKTKDPLGISFLSVNDFSFEKSPQTILYKPQTLQLKLEPYLLPDLTCTSTSKKELLESYRKTCMVHQIKSKSIRGIDNIPSEVAMVTDSPITTTDSNNPSLTASYINTSSTTNAMPSISLARSSSSNIITDQDNMLLYSTLIKHNKQYKSSKTLGNDNNFSENDSLSTRSNSIKYPVAESRDKIVRDVTGSVMVTIYQPNIIYSMCGWLHKKSNNTLLSSETYHSYWFVLVNSELSYYQQECKPGNQPIILKTAKKVIQCEHILSCELVDNKYMLILFNLPDKGDKVYSWQLYPISPHSDKNPRLVSSLARMWLRKIQRCIPSKQLK